MSPSEASQGGTFHPRAKEQLGGWGGGCRTRLIPHRPHFHSSSHLSVMTAPCGTQTHNQGVAGSWEDARSRGRGSASACAGLFASGSPAFKRLDLRSGSAGVSCWGRPRRSSFVSHQRNFLYAASELSLGGLQKPKGAAKDSHLTGRPGSYGGGWGGGQDRKSRGPET